MRGWLNCKLYSFLNKGIEGSYEIRADFEKIQEEIDMALEEKNFESKVDTELKLSQEQQLFFANSQARDGNGNLLTVYHGTGTTIEGFDPSYTGQGNDQYGSGFYFTTDKATAEGYTMSQMLDHKTGEYMGKLGGESNPNVITAYLNLEHPIILNGDDEANLSSIKPTPEQILKLLQHLPSLYIDRDSEEGENNLLGDYFEEFWDGELFAEDYNRLVERLTYEYYADTNLAILDRFFMKYPTEFRQAIREVMGYDGVIVNYEENKHIIAWFPEQIKDVENKNPQFSPYLMDKQDKNIEPQIMDKPVKKEQKNKRPVR